MWLAVQSNPTVTDIRGLIFFCYWWTSVISNTWNKRMLIHGNKNCFHYRRNYVTSGSGVAGFDCIRLHHGFPLFVFLFSKPFPAVDTCIHIKQKHAIQTNWSFINGRPLQAWTLMNIEQYLAIWGFNCLKCLRIWKIEVTFKNYDRKQMADRHRLPLVWKIDKIAR